MSGKKLAIKVQNSSPNGISFIKEKNKVKSKYSDLIYFSFILTNIIKFIKLKNIIGVHIDTIKGSFSVDPITLKKLFI